MTVNDYSVEWCDGGAVFRLLRGDRLNALTLSMLTGLAECLDCLERDKKRFLIITGEGDRAFSAGADLTEAVGPDAVEAIDKAQMATKLFLRLSRTSVLSVAAINGFAFGGGLELAMACTFRIAAPHARMALPEIRLGVLPSYGGTQFLPALVGRSLALDLMLTGRVVVATDALAMGLVTRVADAQTSLMEQAFEFVNSILQYSQLAIDGIRTCVEASGPVLTDAGLAIEADVVRRVAAGPDAREGVQAFLEKRPPVFSHK
ncbi:enoyl-CoA hydratase/isomerase family protein [Bradyrhizobium tropiciagri]|uniref:enoyl-CoA hydratase/isomerase family protein n=1 Tax=Bradyrhizobium tropiciagri TaxID=312253 RepID=UPI001BA9B4F7|nr:enoyl-CoA hydratase-related protein [Bradyrhizobium tropiciagri]MBR0898975.1 enoyl-CoA hydratase/isomerase family protein [Bradyrhizobium tropiciagri]